MRGVLRGVKVRANQSSADAVQNGLRVDRRAVRVGGRATFPTPAREGYAAGKHAPSLLERANFAASVTAFRQHEAMVLAQLRARERRLSRREHRCWEASAAARDSVVVLDVT